MKQSIKHLYTDVQTYRTSDGIFPKTVTTACGLRITEEEQLYRRGFFSFLDKVTCKNCRKTAVFKEKQFSKLLGEQYESN